MRRRFGQLFPFPALGHAFSIWALVLTASTTASAQYYTSPTILDSARNVLQAGSIQQFGTGSVATGLSYPSGLTLDRDGNMYFGNVTHAPVRIALMRLSADRTTLTNLGTVVDTSAGYVSGTTWHFSVAVSAAGEVFYNTPEVRSSLNSVIQDGTIQQLGAGPVVTGLANPSGLALDRDGNLYFGDVTPGPVRVALLRLSADRTTLVNMGTVVDTSAGSIDGAWTFDVAVSAGGDVFYTTPTIVGATANVIQQGTIHRLGSGPVVPGPVVTGLASPSGLAIGSDGTVHFGSLTQSPVRVALMRLSADRTTITNLGTVVDTAAGFVSLGGWGFDVALGPPPPPNAPGEPTLSGDGNHLFINWTAPATGSTPTGYEVVVRFIAGGPIVAVLDVGNVLAVDMVGPSGIYWVSVRAYNESGRGPESPGRIFQVPVPSSPPPGAPANFAVTITGTTVRFTWTPPASAVGFYRLIASATPGGAPIATLLVTAPAAEATVTNVPAGTYFVHLVAVNSGGQSPGSNEVTVVVGVPTPGAPTLNAASVAGRQVLLSWLPAGGPPAISFVAGAALTRGGPLVATLPVNGTSISVPAPPGIYYVVVRGVNEAGAGPASNEIEVVVP